MRVTLSSILCLTSLLPRTCTSWIVVHHPPSRRNVILKPFSPIKPIPTRRCSFPTHLFSQYDDDDDDDDDDETPSLPEQDWREFRAKLVFQQRSEEPTTISSSSQSSSSSSSSSWAYDSGQVIEKGSIILSRPEQDFGYGLRQQYFHKCIILVLGHDEKEFTKGIILNRPSDLLLRDEDFEDDDGEPLVGDNAWKVWFGGDVKGLYSTENEIVCLHCLEGEEAKDVSVDLLGDIQMTDFNSARMLVETHNANTTDFYVFCGYAGWVRGQLLDELNREAWYMVSTDAKTLLEELERQKKDPRDGGLEPWETIMTMIGKIETDPRKKPETEQFADWMLREWVMERLIFRDEETNDLIKGDDDDGNSSDEIDAFIQRAMDAAKGEVVREGAIVRGSSSLNRPPFLLSDQEFHKSLVLLTQDDEYVTVGVLLNHPTTDYVRLYGDDGVESKILQRYGGRFGVKDGGRPLLWFHCNDDLRNAGVGSPVGEDMEGVWKCTAVQAAKAIASGLASETDFLVVSGFSVWEKMEGGVAGGMRGEVWEGNFEVVPASSTQDVWDMILSQKILSSSTLDMNLRLGNTAWTMAGFGIDKDDRKQSAEKLIIPGRDDGAKDKGKGDRCVFKTDVKVSTLADYALKNWVATLLLDDPIE